MKLSPQQSAQITTTIPKNLKILLIYGPDSGQISEKSAQIAKMIVPDLRDPFRISKPSASQCSDYAFLYDELSSQSLMGGRRLIWITNPAETLASSIKKLLDTPPPTDTFMLVEAGELDTKSKIRAIAETDRPEIAALACYNEDTQARARFIIDTLSKEGIKTTTDIASYLAETLPPDRIAMRSEVEKIALYLYGNNTITMEDVRELIKDARAAEQDDLIMEVALGNTKRVAILLDHLFAEQTSPVSIVRAAQRHFSKLHTARFFLDSGLTPTEALNKLTPKIFWKQVDSMKKQLARWSLPAIERLLFRLEEIEALLKKTGAPESALVSHTLLAASARK